MSKLKLRIQQYEIYTVCCKKNYLHSETNGQVNPVQSATLAKNLLLVMP
jgi:hypothetical protein